MKTAQWKIESKLGTLFLVASDKGLQGVYWDKQDVPMEKTPILSKAVTQLKEYFDGKRRNFELPFDVQGTPFQKRVWQQLSKIPFGKTVSYQDIAKGIRNQGAARAVGNANGKNPLCIIVPCHRVILADGSLGGYSGKPGVKSRLLDLEKQSGH